MKKRKLALLTSITCLVIGGMTVSAETKLFTFSLEKYYCDAHVWTASKDDDEQRAYITPTSIVGSGMIWAAVYDQKGTSSYTTSAAIEAGKENIRKTMDYYIKGVAGHTYRLIGCDTEGQVTSDTFQASGRWTP